MDSEQKRTQLNKQKLIEALEASLGIVTEACDKAQLSRTQHYKWYKEDIKYRYAVDSIENKFIDFAETHLKEQSININEIYKQIESTIEDLNLSNLKKYLCQKTKLDIVENFINILKFLNS